MTWQYSARFNDVVHVCLPRGHVYFCCSNLRLLNNDSQIASHLFQKTCTTMQNMLDALLVGPSGPSSLSPSPLRYRYRVIDVFTDTPFEGNPLAVFPEAEGLTTMQMQRIANEFNLSETVFIFNNKDQALRTIRIFTPMREMRFAGHPTIGASWILIDEKVVDQAEFFLDLLIGQVPIQFDPPSSLIWLKTPPIHFLQTFDPHLCAAALSLTIDDLLSPENISPQLLSAGNPTLYVALKDKETVDRGVVDTIAFKKLFESVSEPVCFFFFAPTPSGAYSRMVAPELGIVEDPATGSSTGPLAAYMMRNGLASTASGTRMISEQGVKMGRRSLLHLRIQGENGSTSIDVGGWARPVMSAYL